MINKKHTPVQRENATPPGRIYRGEARLARERARTRSTLTRIDRLTNEVAEAIAHATAPSSQRSAGLGQIWWSIRRKQRESLKLIASLPDPYDEELHAVTWEIWDAKTLDYHNSPDPSWELFEKQAELLAEARAELAPTKRAVAEARRIAA